MALGACGWGPGMRMNEGAIESRARKAGAGADVTLVPLTAKVVADQQAQLRSAPSRTPDPLAPAAAKYEYRVGAFDVLSVIVWGHPELTIPAGEQRSELATGSPVTVDGNIYYPHAGVVPVAGKTLPEIRELLTGLLSRVLEKPQLDVRVAAFRSQKVVVTGEVNAPATLPVTDVPLRVLDAVNFCNGATAEADLQRVVLTRGGKWHVLDIQAASEEGDLSQNWLLQDGDVLHVSDRNLKKVFVVGEVRQPSILQMKKSRMSLAEALGETGWLDPNSSNATGVYVIRGEYEKPKVFRLDTESPDALLLASAFPLRPLDVVFVSTHRLTQWNRVILQLRPTIDAISAPLFYQQGFLPLFSTPLPTPTN